MKTAQVYPYIYTWKNTPKRATLYGRRLRVIANIDRDIRSVEFENGTREIVSVRAIRMATTPGAVRLAKDAPVKTHARCKPPTGVNCYGCRDALYKFIPPADRTICDHVRTKRVDTGDIHYCMKFKGNYPGPQARLQGQTRGRVIAICKGLWIEAIVRKQGGLMQ